MKELPTLPHPVGCICRQCCKVGEFAPSRRADPQPVVSVHSDTFKHQPDQCRKICALAATFHVLGSPVPELWDIDRFMQPLGVAGSGHRAALCFIASVWNPGYARENGWTFDVMDALSCWDSSMRAAFCAWAANPFWP